MKVQQLLEAGRLIRRALKPVEKRAVLKVQQWFAEYGFEQDDSVCSLPKHRSYVLAMGFVGHDRDMQLTLFADGEFSVFEVFTRSESGISWIDRIASSRAEHVDQILSSLSEKHGYLLESDSDYRDPRLVNRALLPSEKRAVLELQQWLIEHGFEQDDSVCIPTSNLDYLLMMGFVGHGMTLDVTLYDKRSDQQLSVYKVVDGGIRNIYYSFPEKVGDLLAKLKRFLFLP